MTAEDNRVFYTLLGLFGVVQTLLTIMMIYFQYRMLTTRDCRKKQEIQQWVDISLATWTLAYIVFIGILRLNLTTNDSQLQSMKEQCYYVVVGLKILIALIGLIGVFFNHNTSFAYNNGRVRGLFLYEVMIMALCGLVAGVLFAFFQESNNDIPKIIGITMAITIGFYLVFEFSGFHKSLLTDISPFECSWDQPTNTLKAILMSACAFVVIIAVGFMYAAPYFLTQLSTPHETAEYVGKCFVLSVVINAGYIFIYRNRNIGKRRILDLLFWLRWFLVVVKTTLILTVITLVMFAFKIKKTRQSPLLQIEPTKS